MFLTHTTSSGPSRFALITVLVLLLTSASVGVGATPARVDVTRYRDAVVVYVHDLDLLRMEHQNLRGRFQVLPKGAALDLDLQAPWQHPAIVIQTEGDVTGVSVAITGDGKELLSRRIDAGPVVTPASNVPLTTETAFVEPSATQPVDAPKVRQPNLANVPTLKLEEAPRKVSLDELAREVVCDANFPMMGAANNAALTRQTAHPDDATKRSLYVPLKMPIFDAETGKLKLTAHFLCEVPLDAEWLEGEGDREVILSSDRIKIHVTDETFNGKPLLGDSKGGLGQASLTMAVGAKGNIYYTRVPSGVVRFNVHTARWETPPVAISDLLKNALPTAADLGQKGDAGKRVGRWHNYEALEAMNDADTPWLVFSPIINRGAEWSGVFIMDMSAWDDAERFKKNFRLIGAAWPTHKHAMYDTPADAKESKRRLYRFEACGNTLYVGSYPGAKGSWRFDLAPDGSVKRFGTPQTMEDFNAARTRPKGEPPFNACGTIEWPYGTLTMSRADLRHAFTGDQPKAAARDKNPGGELTVRYDAIAAMRRDPERFTEYLASLRGPSQAPAYMAMPLPGVADKVLGVSEYGYNVGTYEVSGGADAPIQKAYLPRDVGMADINLPLTVGLGPYAAKWMRSNGDDWLYMVGYIGMARMQYTRGGKPLDAFSMDVFTPRLAKVHADNITGGALKRHAYLTYGLDGRFFMTSSSTAERGGDLYSGGLLWFDSAKLDTLGCLSAMSRCHSTGHLRARVIYRPDGTPVQQFALAGSFHDRYAKKVDDKSLVPKSTAPKLFLYEFARGSEPRDLYGIAAPEGPKGAFLTGQAFSRDRRYLIMLFGPILATFNMALQRYVDAKQVDGYITYLYHPTDRLLRTPDDRLMIYAAADRTKPVAGFHEVIVSPRGEISLRAHLTVTAADARTMEQTFKVVRAFAPDLKNNDGSCDLFLGTPFRRPGTSTVVIPDFLPPRGE